MTTQWACRAPTCPGGSLERDPLVLEACLSRRRWSRWTAADGQASNAGLDLCKVRRAPSAKGDGCFVCSQGSRSPGNPALKVAGRQPSGAVGGGTHCDYERRACKARSDQRPPRYGGRGLRAASSRSCDVVKGAERIRMDPRSDADRPERPASPKGPARAASQSGTD